MTQEEIKSKLALTENQKALVEKFNKLLKEMKENHIGIIYDSRLDSMSFSAYNAEDVLSIGNSEWLEYNDDEMEDVEICMEWGNLDFENSIDEYNDAYGNLHAVFGCKSSLNESMMSAAL